MVNKRYKALNKCFFLFLSNSPQKHMLWVPNGSVSTTTNVYIEKINMKNLTIFSVVGKATDVGAMGWNSLGGN